MPNFTNFSDLGQFMNARKEYGFFPPARNSGEDLLAAIISCFSTKSIRGMDEIMTHASHLGFENDIVQSAVIYMRNEGMMIEHPGSVLTYSLSRHPGIFSFAKMKPAAAHVSSKPSEHSKEKAEQVLTRLGNSEVNKMLLNEAGYDKQVIADASHEVSHKVSTQVKSTDDYFVAIWKVMSDLKPLTAKEVGILVNAAQIRFNSDSIQSYVYRLDREFDWFDVTREKEPGARGRVAAKFTLKVSVECPENNTMNFDWFKTAASGKATSLQKRINEKKAQIKELAKEMITPVVPFKSESVVSKEPLHEEPKVIEEKPTVRLFEMAVMLKGQAYSAAEFKALMHFFKCIPIKQVPTFIEPTLTLKGVTFTYAELDKIFQEAIYFNT